MVVQSFGDNKAKVYYKRNYGNQEEKNEESQDLNALNDVGDVFSETVKENLNHNSLTQTYNSLLEDYPKITDTNVRGKEVSSKGYKSHIKEKIFVVNHENEECVTQNSVKPMNTGGSCEESFINILANLDGVKMKDRIMDKFLKITKNVGDNYSTTADKTNSKTTNKSHKIDEMHNKPSKKNKEQLIKEYEKRIEELKSEEDDNNGHNNKNHKSNISKNNNYSNKQRAKDQQKITEKSPDVLRTNSKDGRVITINDINKNKYESIGLNLKSVFQFQKQAHETKNLETKVEKRDYDFLLKESNKLINLHTKNYEEESNNKRFKSPENHKLVTLKTDEVIQTYNPSYTIYNSTKANNYNIINKVKDILKRKESPTTHQSNNFHSVKKKPNKNLELAHGLFSSKPSDPLSIQRHSLTNVLSGSHRPKESSPNHQDGKANVNANMNYKIATPQTQTNLKQQRSASSGFNFDKGLSSRVYSPLASSIKTKIGENEKKKTNIISNFVKNQNTEQSNNFKKSTDNLTSSSNNKQTTNLLQNPYSTKNTNNYLISKLSYNDLGKANLPSKMEKIEKISNVYNSKTPSSPYRPISSGHATNTQSHKTNSSKYLVYK